jgi:hypothetical protein
MNPLFCALCTIRLLDAGQRQTTNGQWEPVTTQQDLDGVPFPLTIPDGTILHMHAFTILNGTLLCAEHAHQNY